MCYLYVQLFFYFFFAKGLRRAKVTGTRRLALQNPSSSYGRYSSEVFIGDIHRVGFCSRKEAKPSGERSPLTNVSIFSDVQSKLSIL